jgi:hypothetical protein
MRYISPFVAILCLALAPLASGQIIPPPAQSVSKQNVARCNSRVHGNSNKNIEDPQQVVYSPQPGWAILSYHVVDEGSFGTETENWSSVPGNYTFSSSTDVTKTFDSATNLAISAGLKGKQLLDFKAALTKSYNAYYAYRNAIAASQSTIMLKTNAKGNGVFVGTGSQCAIHLDVVEIQIDPNMKTPAAFNAFVINKTKQALAAIPRDKAIQVLPNTN